MAADLAEGARAGNPGQGTSAWQAPEIRNFPRVAQVCERVIRNVVIKRLKALFREAAGDPGNSTEFDELQLATTALMVEAAGLDDDFAPEERQMIVGLLARRFGLSEDSVQSLIAAAEARLDELGITNCDLRVQDVYRRAEAHGFDVIAVTGSIRAYDPRFEQWLNPGGRCFVVIGTRPAMEACLIKRDQDGSVAVESLFETVIPPLAIPGDTGNPPFRF